MAVLFRRLGPYHVARLEALARQTSVVAVELAGVDTVNAWDDVAEKGFERITLFPEKDSLEMAGPAVARRVEEALARLRPRVVAVNGWSDAGALGALRWCLATQTPFFVMVATQESDRERSRWKEAVKRRLVRLFPAALVGGTSHRAYLRRLGMTPEAIFSGYNAVDNDYFAKQTRAARARADALRAELDLPERYFLCTCRFIWHKNLERLLDGYAAYAEAAGAQAWDLVLVGDGPLAEDVRARRAALGLEARVHLPGYKQYDALPAYYALAGAFVLASVSETWGLVVNEAMAAGLPVLVSDQCGCAPDLVKPGVNGYTFSPDDPAALARGFEAVSTADPAAMGAASRRRIEAFSPEAFADGLLAAAEAARQAPPPRASILDRLLLRFLIYR